MCKKDGILNAVGAINVNGPDRHNVVKKSGSAQSFVRNDQLSRGSSVTNQLVAYNNARINSGISNNDNSKIKDYSSKNSSGGMNKLRNYQDYKDQVNNHQDYKSRPNSSVSNLPLRFSSQTVNSSLNREIHSISRPPSQNENTALSVARKALEQQNNLPKMAPVNFPPLRAPQSIVNVRHPFVTEARTKQDQNIKAKTPGVGTKEVEHRRQNFQNYNSQMTGIPSVQNLGNVTNIPYARPDSYPQPVTSVLFPDTSQYPHSPPYGAQQIGQYQAYDPNSYSTPVNVNSVISQYSESSIPYPQYENPQFVQNHYPTDLTNSQYQYQASVSQIQDSPLFIQNLQSPITVTDQYATPNYARAVRTELMPRLRRPPRFNK